MTEAMYYMVFVLFLVLVTGCGGPIQTHSTAITVSAGTVSVGGAIAAEARAQALDRVTEETEGQPREERAEALRVESARWDPLGAILNSCKEVLQAWHDTVEAVHAGAEDLWSRVPLLVNRLVRLWASAVEIARTLGAELPSIPSQVTAVINSFGGQ